MNTISAHMAAIAFRRGARLTDSDCSVGKVVSTRALDDGLPLARGAEL